jgi:hypothetical protein
VKFLVSVTMQGTPITVLGPFDGRHHDMRTLQHDFEQVDFLNPLREHFCEDLALCDLGYLGMRQHTIVPHKRPPRGELSEAQKHDNAVVGKKRSRVEHTFSQIKAYWKLFAAKVRTKPEILGTLFRLAVLAESIVCHNTNQVVPRYATATTGSHDELPPINVNSLTPARVWHERPAPAAAAAERRGARGARIPRPMRE